MAGTFLYPRGITEHNRIKKNLCSMKLIFGDMEMDFKRGRIYSMPNGYSAMQKNKVWKENSQDGVAI